MLDVRPYVCKDQAALLALIERSISTDRTAATWQGNPMTAVLAWDGDALIGALPMEQRTLQLGGGASARVLWISAAHVDENYRSQGVGGKLDAFAREHFSGQFDAFCVYREDETSAAFNWYRKMGYFPMLPILAFRKDVAGGMSVDGVVIENAVEAGHHSDALLSCLDAVAGLDGGYPARETGYWKRFFTSHYYGAYYEYSILALHADGAGFAAYALLGQTDMRDGIDRIDILEFIAPEGDTANLLHEAVEHRAQALGVTDLRLQTGGAEPLRWWAQGKGYVYRDRRTNILANLADARTFLASRMGNTPFALSIETPACGKMTVTQKGADLSLYMNDETLHQLAFNRLDVIGAVDEGRIVVLRGDHTAISGLAQVFRLQPWRYLQADYI